MEGLRLPEGRFRLEERLTKSGHLETWLGRDTESAQRIVVKTTLAASLPASARRRIELDVSALSKGRLRRVSAPLAVGTASGVFFVAAPYLPGPSLEARLNLGPLPLLDALLIGRHLFEALCELHGRGVLHRDVKPSNIFPGDGPDGENWTLSDIGLGATIDALPDQPVEVFRHVSPEQLGMTRTGVDERSDLYSAGSVLYECLSGRAPHQPSSIRDLFRKHLSAQVPPLRSLRAETPPDLDALIRRLLRKEPRDRYQSAEGVLTDLSTIHEHVSRGEEVRVIIGRADLRRGLAEPDFVGRLEDLAALEESKERAARGTGSLVLLEAESGGGKTRFLDELAARQAGSVRVFRGQSEVGTTPVSFGTLAGVADDLSSEAQNDPAFARRVSARMSDRRVAASTALPQLTAVLETVSTEKQGPEAFARVRAVESLALLLDALGEPEQPALVLLDDCQWAEEETIELLRHWQEQGINGAGRRYVMIVASFRSEEVPPEHPLRAIRGADRYVLSPLRPDDIRALLESMAGPLPGEVVDAVADLSAGSPFMASAVLSGILEAGGLSPTASGWSVDRCALHEVRTSRYAAVYLSRRLVHLPDNVLELLSSGAVLGREFDLDLAASLVNQPLDQALAGANEASRRQLLWTRGLGNRCILVHDKVREALLERLTPEARRRLHGEAGQYLEESGIADPAEVAHHFDSAGEPAKALPHALVAGDRARASHALEMASFQYGIAVRGATDDATRLRANESLADVLLLLGRYDEAEPFLNVCLACARDTLDQARVESKMGEFHNKRGDFEPASQWTERGLRRLGQPTPQSRAGLLAWVVWEVVIQALHSLFPSRLIGRLQARGSPEAFLSMNLYTRLANVSWFRQSPLPILFAHLRGMNLAERHGPSPEMARVYAEHAVAMTVIPWFSRAIAYGERSLEIRREQEDLWGQGQSLNYLGVALLGGSRLCECIESCREAIRLLARAGDRWEVNLARITLSLALYRQGHLDQAVTESRRLYRDGLEIGDPTARSGALDAWSKSSGGRVPAGLITTEMQSALRDLPSNSFALINAEAIRVLRSGRAREAAERFDEAAEIMRKHRPRQEYVMPHIVWRATALRVWLEQTPPYDPRARAALLRRATRQSRRALSTARWYRNNLPHALRERALILAARGRGRRPARLLALSLDVARKLGMRQEEALTRLALGELGSLLGWAGAAEQFAEGQRMQGEIEQKVERVLEQQELEPQPLAIALAERLEALFDTGRQISASLTKDDVYAALREAGGSLLRGEYALVVGIRAGEQEDCYSELEVFGPATGASLVSRMSRSIDEVVVRRACAERRPILLQEDGPDSPSDLLLLAGVRSVLCAPVFAHARAVACLWVVHTQVGRLFGETEVRLAQFVTSLAGSSLEVVYAVARIQALSEEREHLYREAQQALELRDDFVSVAAHELRTPMASLSLNVQDLLQTTGRGESPPPEELRLRLASADRSVRRFKTLVENLLDVSRASSGHLYLELEPVDLSIVVTDVLREIEVMARKARCPLTLTTPDSLVGIWDRARLESVTTNLLMNALKFGAGAPVEVEVSETDGVAKLRVRDRGIGIPKDKQPRIFERFEVGVSFQHYGGMGLGLWLSRAIVEGMGGQIEVDSEPGRGSTFTVSLPLKPVES